MWRPQMLAVLVAMLAAADARTLTGEPSRLTPAERASLTAAGFVRVAVEIETVPAHRVAGERGTRALQLTAAVEMAPFLDDTSSASLSTADSGCNNVRGGEECKMGDFRSDPDSRKYYKCVHGELKSFTCPSNTQWNKYKNICDWPTVLRSDERSGSPTPLPEEERPTVENPTAASTTLESTTTLAPPANATDDSEMKVVCFFDHWAPFRSGVGQFLPSDIDASLCTHIVYFTAVLDGSTLSIQPAFPRADLENKFYEKVVAYRAKGVKVSLMLGGWHDSDDDKYSRLVSNPAARERFVNTTLEYIEEHGFDGLDLSWRYPKCWQGKCDMGPESDKKGFAALVTELRAAFRPKGFLLSATVTGEQAVIDAGFDVPALSRDLDWIAVMAYDFRKPWDKRTGHAAPLYDVPGDVLNANFSMNYWMAKGADKKKLVMGIPTFGRSFTLADNNTHGVNSKSSGPGEAGEFTDIPGLLAYYEVCDFVWNGWPVVSDLNQVWTYAYHGDQWVSFDDVEEVRRKSQFIKELGLAGGMVSAMDMDDFKNRCGCGQYPLLKTINKELRGLAYSSIDCM